jgi:hypothetical protein
VSEKKIRRVRRDVTSTAPGAEADDTPES